MGIELLYIFGSVILISLMSLIGLFTFLFSSRYMDKVLLFLVSFSAGALLGDVFIHLLPELSQEYGLGLKMTIFILLGILMFFSLEKFIHWRHCHTTGECDIHEHRHRHKHSLAIMNLVGDGLHNFIDGIIIAASYMLSIPVGIATTIAVLLHEVPQEVGDFGVLLHAGYSKAKALMFNFFSALLALLGAFFAIMTSNYVSDINGVLIAIAIGGFIYIAGTDLIPELHKENTLKSSILQLIGITSGIAVMMLLLLIGWLNYEIFEKTF